MRKEIGRTNRWSYKFGIVGFLVFITLFIAAISGWIMNVVAILNMANGPITGMFILRCVGIFVAPLGAVIGWI